MATFDSIEAFEKYAKKIINQSLQEAGQEVVDKMKVTIQSLAYGTYTPVMYKRTGRLANAPRIISKGDLFISVGIDQGGEAGFLDGYENFETIIDEFSAGRIISHESVMGARPPLIVYRPAVPLCSTLTKDINELEKKFIAKLKSNCLL